VAKGGFMLRKYVEFIVRFRIAVIILVALITVFIGSRIKELKVEVDPDKNLPQSHPYVVAQNQIDKIFGGRNLVVIGVIPKEGDIFQPQILEKIMRITQKLNEIPGAIKTNIFSIASRKAKDIKGTEEGMVIRRLMETVPQTREGLDELKNKIYRNPLFINSIISKDGRAAQIIADFRFNKELKGYPDIERRIKEIVSKEEDSSVSIHLNGPSIALSWLAAYSQKMGKLFLLAMIVIAIVLFMVFGTFQGMFLPLITAIISVLWGLGIMGLLHVPMDPFNAATPILILAIAAGHSIQILKRYYEEYAVSGDNKIAVIESTSRIGIVMITAGLIAAASFLSLLTFETMSIRNFGVFTALGILSALIIEMTFIPALRATLRPPKNRDLKEGLLIAPLNKTLDILSHMITNGKSKIVIGAIFIITAVVAAGGYILNVDNSLKSNFKKSTRLIQDDNVMNTHFGGTNSLSLFVEGNKPDDMKRTDVLKAIEGLQVFLEKKFPEVGKTLSFVDFIKKMNQAMNNDNPAFNTVPDTQDMIAQYLFLYSMSGDPGDFDSYVDYDYKKANILTFCKTDSTAFADQIIEAVNNYVAQNFPKDIKVTPAGSLAVSDALNHVMVHGKIRNILQIAGIVFAMGSVVLGSPLGGLFIILPLAISVIFNFGVMGYVGISLNIGTAAISAMAVGIGADYAIYYIYRLREEMGNHTDLLPAIAKTMKTSGKAINFVSISIALGYLMLPLSGFGLHIKLGTLVALAMIVSSITAITALPALIVIFKPRFALKPILFK
jgi:predicted RND superfamily exporter protein